MKKLILCLAAAVGIAAWQGPAPVWSAEPLRVVTSSAFFADLVKKVGGERVQVDGVAPPAFNPHFVQPKPSDVRKVRRADLYVFAGLDLEAWSDPLVEAAGRPELFRGADRSLDLSRGIRIIGVPEGPVSRKDGDIHLYGNPHYTLDPSNALVMAQTIADKLSQIDPEAAEGYHMRAEAFSRELRARMDGWKAMCAHCAGREVYGYHEDMEYLAGFLGCRITQHLEPKPGIPPTPKHLKELESDAAGGRIKAVLAPSFAPLDTCRRFAERIGAEVLVMAQNPGELEGADDVIGVYDRNIRLIAETLKG